MGSRGICRSGFLIVKARIKENPFILSIVTEFIPRIVHFLFSRCGTGTWDACQTTAIFSCWSGGGGWRRQGCGTFQRNLRSQVIAIIHCQMLLKFQSQLLEDWASLCHVASLSCHTVADYAFGSCIGQTVMPACEV